MTKRKTGEEVYHNKAPTNFLRWKSRKENNDMKDAVLQIKLVEGPGDSYEWVDVPVVPVSTPNNGG